MLAWYKILYYLCNRERERQTLHDSKFNHKTNTIMKATLAMKTRKEAARELWAIYCAYEVRPVKLATIYRRIWFDGSNWRLIGYAHDYTA